MNSSILMIKMYELINKKRLEHAPNLNTVLMIEHILQNIKESVISIPELKRRLPRQVNHKALMIILQYLEYSNKIAVTLKGITWIHNTNIRLKKAIAHGLEL